MLPQLQVDYLPHFSPKASLPLVEQVQRIMQLEQKLSRNPHRGASEDTSLQG